MTAEWWQVPQLRPRAGQQEWVWALQQGCNWGQRQWEQWVAPPQKPLLSSDHRFESDRSTASTSSSVSSMSERLGGLRCPCHGWCPCWEPGGHMKINLPVFKDEDTNIPLLTRVGAGIWQCIIVLGVGIAPFSPCHPFLHYPGELVRSSQTEITLDDVLTILDEHYDNLKVLDALNQEHFQLCMGKKETVSDWGVHLSWHLQILAATFPECFPPDCVAKLKCHQFYSWLPK